MNLQGLLVQSSKWFGISSVQFSSLVTIFSGKFSSVQFPSHHFAWKVQFSSVHGRSQNLKSSISSVQSSSASVQFDVQFSGTPNGAEFGVLLGNPRRVPVRDATFLYFLSLWMISALNCRYVDMKTNNFYFGVRIPNRIRHRDSMSAL